MSVQEIKPIAFYLPQFHTIPENDKAHGLGFTEWVNVKKAYPLYEGHYQPRIPLDDNYYSLLEPETMIWQTNLAKSYGVYGFCYYHYWFKNGKKLLEKPIEMMLNNKEIDMPFCLCWANENWTKRWDGGNNEVIISQDYGDTKNIEKHVDYLSMFFKDDRYIKVDGAPLLIIYKPEIIPNLKRVIRLMRERAAFHGFRDLKIACQYPVYYYNNINLELFDYYIQFEPFFSKGKQKTSSRIKGLLYMSGIELIPKLAGKLKMKVKNQELSFFEYDEVWEKIINYPTHDKKLIAGAFVDWDNTARNKKGSIYKGANPEKFGKYMKILARKIREEYSTNYLFINAWNEWGEGCYLEPDERFNYEYLIQLQKAIEL